MLPTQPHNLTNPHCIKCYKEYIASEIAKGVMAISYFEFKESMENHSCRHCEHGKGGGE